MARRASNVDESKSDFAGLIAGVGALGSTLCDLWSKECWGTWSVIDNDILKPHNVIRHIGRNSRCGSAKVDVVKSMLEDNYHPGYYSVKALNETVTNWSNNQVKETVTGSEFLVDATTAIDVPRDLSRQDDAPRSASVFMTPSGQDSVLLLESLDRSVRLDSIEAQYYRALISSDWGRDHLVGHSGNLWVGAGCRDVSAVISNELVTLHASILARQTRLLRDQPGSAIRIWRVNDDSGEVSLQKIPVQGVVSTQAGEWRIVWDEGIEQKLNKLRHLFLPSETGGVVIGYIEHCTGTIMLVDVLPAPPDSEGDRTGFLRGIEGLPEALKEIDRRTGGVVGYLGEWHSHPPFTSAEPSRTFDRKLIAELSRTLSADGEPALMVIIGIAGEISITVKEELPQ
jgi:hypothetical protein